MTCRSRWLLPAFAAGLSVIICADLTGCAAGRALDKPAPKNYGVLKPGTNRDLVRAELGQAQASVSKMDCDVFAFEKGSSGWKYMRAIGYSLLDIGTLGVSEVVTNPAEASVGKDKERVRVCYDKSQNVLYSERMAVGQPAVLLTGAYPPPSADVFTVSGGISGLLGSGLVLTLNGNENTAVTDNGAFSFNTGVPSGQTYAVTVQTQPVSPAQVCSISQGNGTINANKVSNVSVNCVTSVFSVWGQINGPTGTGLVLQNNNADDVKVTGAGPLRFPSKLSSGSSFNVTIYSQPVEPDLVCTVAGGSGTVGNGDVTTVEVQCQSDIAPAVPAVADGAASGPATAQSAADTSGPVPAQ